MIPDLRRFFITLLIVILSCGTALACSLGVDTVGLTSWSGGDGRGYDVFDETVYYQPLTLKVSAIDADCPFYVTVAATMVGGAGGLLTGPGTPLVFEVYRDASGAQAMRPSPLATQSETLVGTASRKGPPETFQVVYSIPALQIVPPGVYSGQITIAVYEGSFGSGLLRIQKQVPLSITIPSIAELTFATATFKTKKKQVAVDFGVMSEGKIKGVTLHARGNGGYRISVNSGNGGVMLQPDPSDKSAVSYTLSIDGRPVKLGKSEDEAVIYQGTTDAHGNDHRFDFRIGSIREAAAGDYEDTVSVTIMSLR